MGPEALSWNPSVARRPAHPPKPAGAPGGGHAYAYKPVKGLATTAWRSAPTVAVAHGGTEGGMHTNVARAVVGT